METALSLLEWGMACRPAAPDTILGDGHLIQREERGILVAAIDGLGHGDKAADSTSAARDALASLPGVSLERRMSHCHERLQGTRGVALSLAWLDGRASTMTWLGVGNIEGVLATAARRITTLLLRGGVVGRRLPWMTASTLPIAVGDTLVFVTDGIGPDFERSLIPGDPPQRQAERILNRHFRGGDDALVVVATFRGPTQ